MFSSFPLRLYRTYLLFRRRLDAILADRLGYDFVELRLGGPYPEEAAVRTPFFLRRPARPTLLQALSFLDEVRRDDRIKTILLRIHPLAVGWSRLESLGRALDAIRESGKEIHAYLEHAGTREYFLAARCDSVTMPETAALDLTGLRAEIVFAKDLLDRLDVSAEFLSVGKYKSAAETATRRDLSKPARENLESILDSVYGRLVDTIAEGRGLSRQRVRELVDRGPYLPEEARKAGLLDRLAYGHELRKFLTEEKKARRIRAVLYRRIAARRRMCRMLGSMDHMIGVLVAEGIVMFRRPGGPVGSTKSVTPATMRKAIRHFRRDPRIKAVVLRVNSPGGDGLASDLIFQELRLLAEKKPLVVSMGDVAASGGYYLALAGQHVVVEPGTLTGSIGVIAGKLSFKGLYAKLGLRKTVLKRGENADLQSDYVPFGPGGRERVKRQVDFFYKDFVAKVAASREMTARAVGRIAQGRVWTGEQAVENGLADSLGGLPEAIREAGRRSHVSEGREPLVVQYQRPRAWWRLREEDTWNRIRGALGDTLDPAFSDLGKAAAVCEVFSSGRPAALLPFSIRIF